jgi:hypothetical protein
MCFGIQFGETSVDRVLALKGVQEDEIKNVHKSSLVSSTNSPEVLVTIRGNASMKKN